MRTAFREPISTVGMGNEAACVKMLYAVTQALEDLNRPIMRAHHSARVFFSPEDVDDEGLDNEELNKLAHGIFPFLWFNLTYDLDNVTEGQLRQMEEHFSLRLFSAGVSKYNHPF